MPYKNKEKRKISQRKSQKRYWDKHKESIKQQRKEKEAELREFISQYKASKGCATCGENDPACLQFHHRNQDEKDFKISLVSRWTSKARLLEEMEKCVVLCANCHYKLHYTNYHK